ncbi:MAG: ATP-binding protein [Acidobacteria bacterium]|nr:ATP-binding protein [Acidobacteriota bacterium]
MACEQCHGSYWVTEIVDGVDRVRRCDCWRQSLGEHQLANARIPRRYQHCQLSNFEQTVDSLREAHRRARAFVDAFPAVDKGLLLRGRHGVGKTHLAVAMLREIMTTKGARGYFYETRELLKLVRDTFAGPGESELDVLRPVLEADILVLDDLGAEKTSEWVQETLGLVVNTRYSERRPTIFTTNLDDSADTTNPNSMYVQLGARTRSRLFEMCHWVDMEGPDVREVGSPNPTPADIARYNQQSPLSDKNRRSGGVADRPKGMARASLRPRGNADVAWSGGKGGSG